MSRHALELRTKTPSELLQLLSQSQEELVGLRFQLATTVGAGNGNGHGRHSRSLHQAPVLVHLRSATALLSATERNRSSGLQFLKPRKIGVSSFFLGRDVE